MMGEFLRVSEVFLIFRLNDLWFCGCSLPSVA